MNCFDADRNGSIDRSEFIRTCVGVKERAARKARRSSAKFAKAKVPGHRVSPSKISTPWKQKKVSIKAELEKDKMLMKKLGLTGKSDVKKTWKRGSSFRSSKKKRPAPKT